MLTVLLVALEIPRAQGLAHVHIECELSLRNTDEGSQSLVTANTVLDVKHDLTNLSAGAPLKMCLSPLAGYELPKSPSQHPCFRPQTKGLASMQEEGVEGAEAAPLEVHLEWLASTTALHEQ